MVQIIIAGDAPTHPPTHTPALVESAVCHVAPWLVLLFPTARTGTCTIAVAPPI